MRLQKPVQITAAIFLVALLLAIFSAVSLNLGTWPAKDLRIAFEWTKRYFETGAFRPKYLVFVPAKGMPENSVTRAKDDAYSDRYLAIMHWNEKTDLTEIKLLNEKREEIHTWPIDYSLLFDADLKNPHGLVVLPDGSVVINFDKANAIARFDACGTPMWATRGVFHHQISQGENGSLWTWQGEKSAYDQFQKIVQIDAETGAIVRSIDLIEDIIKAHDAWEIFGLSEEHEFVHEAYPGTPNDIFHPNDVEPLGAEYAREFPMFGAGDLLLSFKTSSLVVVVDGTSNYPKWHFRGPLREQHDPDFLSNGMISVFNNYSATPGQSELVLVNPGDNTYKVSSMKRGTTFYTTSMGAHEILPRERMLIVVPGEGRVLEVNNKGELLFQFYNIATSKALARVQNAVWLHSEFFDSVPTCK